MRQLQPFYHFKLLCLCVCVSAISACSTLGYEGVDTTRKAIVVATIEIRESNLLLQDLIQRNVIPDDKARDALQRLRQAQESLRIAQRTVEQNGDPVIADDNLARANIAINIALSLLAQFGDLE